MTQNIQSSSWYCNRVPLYERVCFSDILCLKFEIKKKTSPGFVYLREVFSVCHFSTARRLEEEGNLDITQKGPKSQLPEIKLYVPCCTEEPNPQQHGLRRRSAAIRLLRLWVRISTEAGMSVFCECCVSSEVSASGWSLVQRSPTENRVSKWMWSWSLDNEEALAH
jgi:hypothetical protein